MLRVLGGPQPHFWNDRTQRRGPRDEAGTRPCFDTLRGAGFDHKDAHRGASVAGTIILVPTHPSHSHPTVKSTAVGPGCVKTRKLSENGASDANFFASPSL